MKPNTNNNVVAKQQKPKPASQDDQLNIQQNKNLKKMLKKQKKKEKKMLKALNFGDEDEKHTYDFAEDFLEKSNNNNNEEDDDEDQIGINDI